MRGSSAPFPTPAARWPHAWLPHPYVGTVRTLSSDRVGLPQTRPQHMGLTQVTYLGDDPRKLGEGEGGEMGREGRQRRA